MYTVYTPTISYADIYIYVYITPGINITISYNTCLDNASNRNPRGL